MRGLLSRSTRRWPTPAIPKTCAYRARPKAPCSSSASNATRRPPYHIQSDSLLEHACAHATGP